MSYRLNELKYKIYININGVKLSIYKPKKTILCPSPTEPTETKNKQTNRQKAKQKADKSRPQEKG